MKMDVKADVLKSIGKVISTVPDYCNVNIFQRGIGMMVDYENPIKVNLPMESGVGRAKTIRVRKTRENPNGLLEFPYVTVIVKGSIIEDISIENILKSMEKSVIEYGAKELGGYIVGYDDNYGRFNGINDYVESRKTIVKRKISAKAMDESLNINHGNPDMIITNRTVATELYFLLKKMLLEVEAICVKGGYKCISYCGVPVYIDDCIPSGQNRFMLFLDTRKVFVSVLTPINFIQLAKENRKKMEYEIFCDEVVVVSNKNYLSKLILTGNPKLNEDQIKEFDEFEKQYLT